MVVYKVRNIYTGEIKETSSVKKSVEIAISDLKERFHDCDGFDCGVLLIEKIIYDCDDSEWDGAYWDYPVLEESTIFTVYVSTMSVQLTRLSDHKMCIIWRGEDK